MKKQVLVPIANGSEEIEAVTVVDVLRRAGAQVTVASVESEPQITASRGVVLLADCLIDACQSCVYDLIVLPGGMPGAETLSNNAVLTRLLQAQQAAGRHYAAICAAPAVVLERHGLLAGTTATAHPGFIDRLPPERRSEASVVCGDQCITSRGPGTALEFALALVARLYGTEQADAVAAPMVVQAGR
ncbi:DJ-1 family glyoxalase III [Motiliproteus sediminis]|uniref:DJ-1 family glyoxalase III n=1 Tax=Motiliproteus sediminis TaxID=1468178 RepID=UPI001AEF5076|nr:DJ-1 family glyoxalase III [Motiliproteus sediminis]